MVCTPFFPSMETLVGGALFGCYIVLLEEEKQVFLVSDRLPLCADPYVKVLVGENLTR